MPGTTSRVGASVGAETLAFVGWASTESGSCWHPVSKNTTTTAMPQTRFICQNRRNRMVTEPSQFMCEMDVQQGHHEVGHGA